MAGSLFILRIFLLVSVLSAVVCQHQKRDVHHRIVLKERAPRSNKKGHPGHGHARHHSGKGHGRGTKKEKKRPGSYSYEDKSSYEDSEGSYSRESGSFEDVSYNHKEPPKPKLHHHSMKHHSHTHSHSHPTFRKTPKIEKSRHEPHKDHPKHFHNEWVPLSSEKVIPHSQENYRTSHNLRNTAKHKKKETTSKKPIRTLKPYQIEITTSYPFQFATESTSFTPTNDFTYTFANYDLNKKIMESNQSPLIGTIEQPKLDFSNLQITSERLQQSPKPDFGLQLGQNFADISSQKPEHGLQTSQNTNFPGLHSRQNFDFENRPNSDFSDLSHDQNAEFSDPNENADRLRNHRPTYEVTEPENAANNVNTFIYVSENSSENPNIKESFRRGKGESKNDERDKKVRGRGMYRGRAKFGN